MSRAALAVPPARHFVVACHTPPPLDGVRLWGSAPSLSPPLVAAVEGSLGCLRVPHVQNKQQPDRTQRRRPRNVARRGGAFTGATLGARGAMGGAAVDETGGRESNASDGGRDGAVG
eukprot:scaffold19651_cov112-Isochrysis_galbana.AAC.3